MIPKEVKTSVATVTGVFFAANVANVNDPLLSASLRLHPRLHLAAQPPQPRPLLQRPRGNNATKHSSLTLGENGLECLS